MKVAIFGDSFGDDQMEKFTYAGWPTILKTAHNVDVDNYSLCGSSLYFSYKEFLKYHEVYDKVIFIATIPNRFMIPNHILFRKCNKYTRHVNSIEMIQKMKLDESMFEPSDIRAIYALEQYYLYLLDTEKEEILHELMKKDVRDRRPDVIMLDIASPLSNPVGLYNISMYELESQGIPRNAAQGAQDDRACHLSKENNKILADKFYSFLKGDPISLTLDEFVKPTEDMRVYLK